MMMKVDDCFGPDTLASAYLSYTYLEALLLFFSSFFLTLFSYMDWRFKVDRFVHDDSKGVTGGFAGLQVKYSTCNMESR